MEDKKKEMKIKKYIPIYGIKHMEDGDFLKMLLYHNLCFFIIIVVIFELLN